MAHIVLTKGVNRWLGSGLGDHDGPVQAVWSPRLARRARGQRRFGPRLTYARRLQ